MIFIKYYKEILQSQNYNVNLAYNYYIFYCRIDE